MILKDRICGDSENRKKELVWLSGCIF